MPPNCHFEIDDASLEWTFPDNTFDYIHIRCLLGSIKDWVEVYRQCFRCLKPGGWLEHTDFSPYASSDDDSLPPDCPWWQWCRLFVEAGRKTGRTFEVTDNDNFVRWMAEAGFSGEVFTYKTKLPMGAWPQDKKWKEVGLFNRISTEAGLEGYGLYACCTVLGWEQAECQLLLARMRQALKNKALHPYYPW